MQTKKKKKRRKKKTADRFTNQLTKKVFVDGLDVGTYILYFLRGGYEFGRQLGSYVFTILRN